MKHKIRLLIDCHCFDFKISQGMTTYIKGIYSLLPALASDIDFFFVGTDIVRLKEIFGDSPNINYIPLKAQNRIYRLFFEMSAIIKKYKIDVAHFQYMSPVIKNCKTIITLHDILFVDYPQYFPFSYRISKTIPFKLSAKRADILCSVSGYSQKQITEHFNIPENRIIITPNAVDQQFFDINSQKPENFPEKYLLYVSRIEPRKNHKAVVAAFKRLNLAAKGYNLVFIGKETVPTPELHELINSLPSTEKDAIKFYDQVSFNDLKLWYKYADLFLYPTLAEGFGIPPIEAGAAGVPVLCHNETAMADFTMFGENLIDFNNPEEVDKAIMRCLNNRDEKELNRISLAIGRKYNWEESANILNKKIHSLFG